MNSFFFNPCGFTILIVALLLFVVDTQYLYFMPRFALPHGVRIRSKWGYAFNGELEELKRINGEITMQKVPRLKAKADALQIRSDALKDQHRYYNYKLESCGDEKYNQRRYEMAINDLNKQLDRISEELKDALNRLRSMERNYWDEHVGDIPGTTPAMFALANGHHDVVAWLEQAEPQRAEFHKRLLWSVESPEERVRIARNYIDP